MTVNTCLVDKWEDEDAIFDRTSASPLSDDLFFAFVMNETLTAQCVATLNVSGRQESDHEQLQVPIGL